MLQRVLERVELVVALAHPRAPLGRVEEPLLGDDEAAGLRPPLPHLRRRHLLDDVVRLPLAEPADLAAEPHDELLLLLLLQRVGPEVHHHALQHVRLDLDRAQFLRGDLAVLLGKVLAGALAGAAEREVGFVRRFARSTDPSRACRRGRSSCGAFYEKSQAEALSAVAAARDGALGGQRSDARAAIVDARCATSDMRARRAADANNSRGAGGGARGGAPEAHRAAGGRAGPRALPAAARPRHRCSGADVPRRSATLKLALKLRPFSGEVVTLAGTMTVIWCVAAVPDGRIITGSDDEHRQGVARRRVRAHHPGAHAALRAVAVLPGGARFVSGSLDGTVKLWTLDGTLERTFEVGGMALCIAALPDGVHFVVGLGPAARRRGLAVPRRRHARPHLQCARESRNRSSVYAVTVTRDGQHIISGGYDDLVKVWSVASKSLVSTCEGARPAWLWRWRRCPTASASSAAGPIATSGCGASTAPARRPSGCAPAT